MSTLSNYSSAEIINFRGRLQQQLEGCADLQEASQKYIRLFYAEFQESVVLARLFLTVPLEALPSRDQAFVTNLAAAEGIGHLLNGKTLVLSLLATCGGQPGWNDRYQSQGHLGIPLVTASFVESIPMVSRLMHDMGIGLAWLDEPEQDFVVKSLGQIAGVFYVRDAKTRLDRQHRKIVSAQDFVAAHDVRTVFGLGGSYLNGSFVTTIVFTRETIERSQIEGFLLLVNTFKVATMSLVMQGKIFS